MSEEKKELNPIEENSGTSASAAENPAKKEKPAKEKKEKKTKEQKAKSKESKAKAKEAKEAKKAAEKEALASGKSSAELARERRKANVEKTAEKQAEKAKKKEEQTPAQKRAKIIIPSVVVALIIAIFFLCFFGVPERHMTAVKVSDGSKISEAEYEYYYRSLYNYYANLSQQYESYYSSYYGAGAGKLQTGFDYTKTPENQTFTSPSGQNLTVDDSYGSKPTWADYFEQTAIETSQQYTVIYNKAVKAGYKMSKSETKEMNKFIEELRDSAADDDYSLDAYLRENYGRGMTEKLLKEIYIKQTVSADYLDDKQSSYNSGITDKEINAEYKKNSSDYQIVSLRYFNFAAEISSSDSPSKSEIKKANAALLKKAKAFCSAATSSNFTDEAYEYAPDDYKSYYKDDDTYTTLTDTSYSTLTSTISKDAAKWAYSSDTSVGDKKVITVTDDSGISSYYVVLLTSAPKKNTAYPVTVRHILFQVSSDTSSSSSSSDSSTTHTAAEAKKLAKAALKEWKAGDATDASFAALAKKKSEDSGTASDGGLCKDVTTSSGYVSEFTDWCLEDGRKAGDTGIIKTEYGYHVMYCKSVAKEPVWKSTIRTNLGTAKYESFYSGLTKDDSLSEASGYWKKRVRSRVEKYASTVIANLSSSSSSSSSSAS